MKKRLLLLSILFLSFFRIDIATARDEVRVLVLLSLDVTYPYVKSKVDGLAFEGTRNSKTILLDIQSLEDERFTDADKLHSYYTAKAEQLKNSHPDVIAVTGSPVIFSFYNNYLYPLMPDVPMVGETRIVPENHKPPTYSFIQYHQNIPKTINMALEITKPKNIYLIGDATHPGSRLSMKLVEKSIPKGTNINIERLDMPLNDLIKAAKDLPKNSVGFFSLIFSDGHGNRIVPENALMKIAENVPFPIFAFHETMVGSGATGGVVAKGEDVGIQLVKESLLAVESRPFNPPRIVPAISSILFDGHFLDKYHIKLSKLPEGAEVINITPGLLDKYWYEILAIISLIIILSSMILILFHFYRQRNKLTSRLSIINEELEQRVDDRTHSLLEANSALHKKESEITHLMLTDSLTGLPNRRYFEDEVHREFKRSERNNSNLCIAVCDIDHFKSINDFYGHNVGDIVLSRLARCINETVRQSDFVARWGGDEFVIIHIDSDRVTAEKFAKRVLLAVEKLQIKEIMKAVTISIGISQRKENDSLKDLMERADQAMYKSKTEGTNRISYK
ncbi:MAG: GGDEF domain-containing protein [Gammaproteobacteria bacterium]|jgi:diguanylate cyclase (GGDEF)-like protein|nr:GGDEF domain-containing protein [Gammaproteobacteria bacterium]MBT4078695.1 GGDEF domain-containing protein [Gammaproteobacteria bacterium]MBT4196164.1 GGDEF domain-containing protein [Gammaproteobacteria bacterium]MBT4448291.1 GGDEF domain-containing protein [Gammaproteobacteria bacterium]MBT6457488.1 GGDEF domain-containing protein [Gammaproteobacteria bacterium]